ncbi:helix-turn-helix transcriptional regulator [Priestia flexa]|uniref:helix-turn-helix domain-containing protein n=1 Tax=Priestia flexa TaxID=86664 RepID=UPI002E1E41FB|nr:helix-turn-helix transcriptional regulator [Priestia flexa]
MTFGKYLKTKREEKNLSMNKLGELAGITAMYISQLESGKRDKPSIEVLKKLSKSLDVPYKELMNVAGYMDVDITLTLKDVEKEEDILEQLRKLPEKLNSQSLQQQKLKQEEQFKLDLLLDSNRKISFQDRLLTNEEKAKIKSVIEIVLKD